MTRILIWIFFSFGLAINSIAQVAINNDGSLPHESSMLDIVSTDKGMLIPRLTST